MIYYLAHKYRGMEEQSFRNAVYWTNLLRQRELTVFSPILHTHPYLEEGKQWMDGKELDCLLGEQWLEWDLGILEGMKSVTILMAGDAFEGDGEDRVWLSKGCEIEYNWAKSHNKDVLMLEIFLLGRNLYL